MKNIEIRNLCKSFDAKPVLCDLSLTFPAGCVTCVSGPSGCGKTTLLRILAGLETADSGSVENLPARVGFVFQEDRLAEDFNALRNIRLVTGKDVPFETIETHLGELGLSEDARRPVKNFSGGMKRRVAIARAVLYAPDLLLLDEPFKGLDPARKREAMAYIQRHTAGRTVICVTHDSEDTELLGGASVTLAPAAIEKETL